MYRRLLCSPVTYQSPRNMLGRVWWQGWQFWRLRSKGNLATLWWTKQKHNTTRIPLPVAGLARGLLMGFSYLKARAADAVASVAAQGMGGVIIGHDVEDVGSVGCCLLSYRFTSKIRYPNGGSASCSSDVTVSLPPPNMSVSSAGLPRYTWVTRWLLRKLRTMSISWSPEGVDLRYA